MYSVKRHTSWTLNLNKSRTCWLSLSWTCETVILQSKDHEYKQRFYHGNNKIWWPNQWKGQVFQVRVVRLKTWIYSELSPYFIWHDRHKFGWLQSVLEHGFELVSVRSPMHIGAINMNDVNNLNFLILSTRYNPKNYCLCGIPMDFHQRLRLRIFWKLCM